MMTAKTLRRKGRKNGRTKRVLLLRVFASLRSCRPLVLSMCLAGAVHAEWSTYHGGADLRGVSAVTLPDQPELLWRYNAGGAVSATPVSDGERIFFTTKKGQVIALDLKGSEVWKKNFTRTNDAGAEMPVQFDAPLACSGSLVFAGTTRGTLLALDAKSGEETWRYETGGIITGSPNLIAGQMSFDREDAKTQKEEKGIVIVLDQAEGALHAVSMETGLGLWKTDGVGRCDGSPGVGKGRIVFGSCLAALHVYSAADGTHLRDVEIGGDAQVAGGAVLDGNLVFAGARDGKLICADTETGEIVWSSGESEQQTFSTPAVTSNLVVYSSDNGFVYAVDREQGKTLWAFYTGGLPTSPVVAQDKIAISADGVLYLLSLRDGHKLWSKEISDEITSPALIGGMIVVGADDGTVSAYGTSGLKM